MAMRKYIKIYLIISLGIFLGFGLFIWIILYYVWVYGTFIFYEDKKFILFLESILSILIIPSLFILCYKVITDDCKAIF